MENPENLAQTLPDLPADRLLETQAPAQADQQYYETEPLLLAVEKGDQEAVQRLIAAKTDLAVQNNLGHNALALAAFKGDLEMVRLLHVAGSWVSGLNPVFLAAYNGHFPVINYLIDAMDKSKQVAEEDFLEKQSLKGVADKIGNIAWPALSSSEEPRKQSQSEALRLAEYMLRYQPDLAFVKKLKDWALAKSSEFCKKFFVDTLVLGERFELVEILYDVASDEDKKNLLLSLFESPYSLNKEEIKILKYLLIHLKAEGKDEKILLQVIFKDPDDDSHASDAEGPPLYSILQAMILTMTHDIKKPLTEEFKYLLDWLGKEKNVLFKDKFLNLKNTQDETALMMANNAGHEKVVAALRKAGASQKARNHVNAELERLKAASLAGTDISLAAAAAAPVTPLYDSTLSPEPAASAEAPRPLKKQKT